MPLKQIVTILFISLTIAVFASTKNTSKRLSVYTTVISTPTKINLYWDTSASMNLKNRGITKELTLLANYFKEIKEASVKVILFNLNQQTTQTFKITHGESTEIIAYLKNIVYDGAANFSSILKDETSSANVTLLFSDGNTLFEPLKATITQPIYCINSSANANRNLLKKIAHQTKGYYIDLTKEDIRGGLNRLLHRKENHFLVEKDTSTKGKVSGSVSSSSGALQGVSVKVKNSFTVVQTDNNGRYTVDADTDDILVFSYLGMIPKEIPVLENNRIDVVLKPDGELLEQVVVKAKKSKSNNTIETGYGVKNKDAIGYAITEVKSKDIIATHSTLKQVIAGKPGIEVKGIGREAVFYIIRAQRSSFLYNKPPIIVFNGLVLHQNGNNGLPEVLPQDIKNIIILNSLSATNRYGSDGAFGAIVINTKNANLSYKDLKKGNSALAKGNNYTEQLNLLDNTINKSNLIAQLEKAATAEDAYKLYLSQKKLKQAHTISYFMDAADYFLKWDKNRALLILSNIAEIAPSNPKALKGLAYKLEQFKHPIYAQYIYEHIVTLRPKQSQSYRDLALIYQTNGAYTKALTLYKKILDNNISGVNFSGLNKAINNEIRHFTALHKKKIAYQKLPERFHNTDFKHDIRIVFNWTDPNSEFELQFVNPQKKFYKWSHSKLGNEKRLLKEIQQGYSIEEFILDDAKSGGKWIINIEYLGDKLVNNPNPTYLKYTIYRNYGLASEAKKVKLIKLYKQQQKVTLDTFRY